MSHSPRAIFYVITTLLLLVPSPSRADEIHPGIYVIIDTSGSMLYTPSSGSPTFGDGSVEHPHWLGMESRIYMAKNALSRVVSAYGEVSWGLAKYAQELGNKNLCLCYDQTTVGPGESPMVCQSSMFVEGYDLPGETDKVCINYFGGLLECATESEPWCWNLNCTVRLDYGDILVGLGEDNAQILKWVDHQETDPQAPVGGGTDPEIRAAGWTPIAGTLDTVRNALTTSDLPGDTLRGCRPYSVILLTDGDETCATQAEAEAAANNLRHTLNTSESCTNNSQCDSGVCDTSAGYCEYDVKTYVIAFGIDDTSNADSIAQQGGTTAAIAATSEDDLVAAMASIIAESIKTELCNGDDDDCDGEIDEDFPVGESCNNGLLGACYQEGTYVCSADQTGVDCTAAPVAPGVEVCDGVDNDCNGLIDDVTGGCPDPGPELCNNNDDDLDGSTLDDGDDDPRVGEVCGFSTAPCTQGSTRCISGNIECCLDSSPPGTCTPVVNPTTETCDNIDNDCDGTVDEGLAQGCYPAMTPGCTANGDGTYACLGICHSGMSVCSLGVYGSCSGAVTPQAEVCDGVDNDCNDAIDDNLGSTSCGLGVCAKSVPNCVGGVPQTCDPMSGASVEVCNNIDDDCDGQVDDGVTQSCYEGTPGTEGVGICRAGIALCSAGVFGACLGQVLPQASETCNNLDDNCDGVIDEGLTRSCYSGTPGTAGVGQCLTGAQTCGAGMWGTCNGEITPVPESCNTLDDDCNGVADDMGDITCGQGQCHHTVPVCLAGVLQVCDPLQGATPESCDGLDNDCDGQADGLMRSCFPGGESGCVWNAGTESFDCVGACMAGLEICPVGGGGVWGSCDGAVVPSPEICDGADNDCDGTVDEDLTAYCYPPGSGVDTGCLDTGDGSWVCQGECSVGVRSCNGGSWTVCNGVVTPTSEVCDGLDNDCDGLIDEDGDIPGMGQPCGGVGVCAPGVRACINGQVVCEGGGDPQPGLCDGLDNNCNGLVDEAQELADDPGVGGACGEAEGACEQGTQECIDGELVCVGGVVPTGEVCNGVDDNCDGTTDEGDLCDPGHLCFDADCRKTCSPFEEQPCPAGYECIEVTSDGTEVHICYPQLAPCGGVYCGQDEVCREGACVNPCEPDPCLEYEACYVNRYAGQIGHETDPEYHCYDVSCTAPGHMCPSGEICIEHQCAPDPCADEPCLFGHEYCVRDGCELAAECTYHCENIPYCETGEVYNGSTGFCERDLCAEVECEFGELCVAGECLEDTCVFITCAWGEICTQGICAPSPCVNLGCPYYTHCEVDPWDGAGWCAPNEGIWTPPLEGDRMTPTGGGLFSCATSPGSDASGTWGGFGLMGLLIAVAVFRRRRAGARRGPRGIELALIVVMFMLGTACEYVHYDLGEDGKLQIPDAAVEPDAEPDADPDADACVAEEEVCDELDNDCNGIIDDYWVSAAEGGEGHFADDIFNCGSCGNICQFIHADPVCDNGTCVMGECDSNWYDFDGDPANGCETSCVISSGGQEICDGVDNDCNGIVDDYWIPVAEGGEGHFDDDPVNCGSCQRVCAFPNGSGGCVDGVCVLDSCSGGYTDADGDPANGCECIITGADDATCDGVDNDCNGQVDEDFVGLECYTGPGCVANGDGTYACTGLCAPGVSQCNNGQEQCVGQVGATLEVCDYADNDCDGLVDEGYDLQTDAANCGACGNSCSFPNAVSRCETGACLITVCQQGFWNNNGVMADGCEYACTITNGGIERCDDGLDNDCDGAIDEFDGQNDANNCGSCGYSCAANAPPHMNVDGCSLGTCQYSCATDYFNYDGVAANGCEYFCQVTGSGTESCDGIDNDCDGTTDEGFDTATDVANCGACGNDCASATPPFMAVSGCSGGTCQYTCLAGHVDSDGVQSNGCEYACTIDNGGVEECDGQDDDCDGLVDEGPGGQPLSRSCYTGTPGTEGHGLCAAGTEMCSSGSWSGVCLNEVTPVAEQCDGADNDCDDAVDNGFDTQVDPLNCGACGTSCFASTPQNAGVLGCSSGACQYQCLSGYQDLNGDMALDGCEYACEPTMPDGQEECNGLDDDCDGQVDEISDLTAPPPGFCKTTGLCAGSQAVCQLWNGSYQWSCNYPAGVERQDGGLSPNLVVYAETLCDDLDGDCDGAADEDFLPIKGEACADDDVGRCKGTGTVVCAADLLGTECNITSKLSPSAEVCNGVDDDCDTLVDESEWAPGSNPSFVTPGTVSVMTPEGYDVEVFEFEASRATASATTVGAGNTRACSRPDVYPWNFVTYSQAQLACSKAGMRLCLADEWEMACSDAGELYPYGDTYASTRCNGFDNGAGESILTGAANQCVDGTVGTYDMSGNLREWTMEHRGEVNGKSLYTLRGGSFADSEVGLQCTFTNSVYVEDAFGPYVGFRCCSSCGNGTVELWEQCDDGNRVNGDGCDYLCASEVGQTCGDGSVDGSEQCDDGNRVDGDGCSSACTLDTSLEICGNGVINGDEQCDDGNTTNGDGCSSTCRTEAYHCGGPQDSFGYEMCSGSLPFIDISSPSNDIAYNSYGYAGVTLPFSVSFYGIEYSSVVVNLYGLLVFGGLSQNSANEALPTTLAEHFVTPWWDSFNVFPVVYVDEQGTAPNRIFIIQWEAEHSQAAPNNDVVFEVVFHEGSNDIDFRYGDVDCGRVQCVNGISGTTGIQGSSDVGDDFYLEYQFNDGTLTNGLSVSFYHP